MQPPEPSAFTYSVFSYARHTSCVFMPSTWPSRASTRQRVWPFSAAQRGTAPGGVAATTALHFARWSAGNVVQSTRVASPAGFTSASTWLVFLTSTFPVLSTISPRGAGSGSCRTSFWFACAT